MSSRTDLLQRTEAGLTELVRSSVFGWPSWLRLLFTGLFLVYGGAKLARGESSEVMLGLGWICLGIAAMVSQRLQLRSLLRQLDATRDARRAVARAEVLGDP